MEVKRVRRLSDGMELEAIRYSEEDGSWSSDCITRVATFVLGYSPDLGPSVPNDRILDVVKPVLSHFDPENGRADIEVADWVAGHIYVVHLGDWIVKLAKSSLWVIQGQFFDEAFEVIQNPHIPSDLENLEELIRNQLFGEVQDGDVQTALAKSMAKIIYNAGWRKQ